MSQVEESHTHTHAHTHAHTRTHTSPPAGDDVSHVEEFLREAIVMESFSHRNLLSVLGVVVQRNTPYVVLPFMANGDLRTHLKKETNVRGFAGQGRRGWEWGGRVG